MQRSETSSDAPYLLYAEDEENDFLFLQKAMARQSAALSIVRACDGLEARALLEDKKCGCPVGLLTDLRMPAFDGFELIAWIKTNPRFSSLPIMALSTSRLERDFERCRSLGVVLLETKPNTPQGYLRLASEVMAHFRVGAAAPTQ